VLTSEVSRAIEEVADEFPGCPLVVREDGSGGAYLLVEGVPLSGPWVQTDTWVGFQVSFQYPYSDVYPHFVRRDLARRDGGPLGEALSPVPSFEGRPAVQISRRSNRREASIETAAMKLHKVLEWLGTRP
jgi:hypothetical protein